MKCPCGRPVEKRGLCDAHYQRQRVNGDPDWARPIKMRRGGRCAEATCEREARRLGYCQRHYKFRWANPGRAIPTEPCPICGAAVDRSLTVRRRYCSKQCRYSSMSDRPNWRMLLRRDGDSCHICGVPVDVGAAPRTARYPTVDHITPRSLGGTDDLANLRLAHAACNTSRGNNIKRKVWTKEAS
jgi:5-methylcytosine-specific restriction endonuclease McrA